MVNKNSILDKVNFLLSIAKKGNCTVKELNEIVDLIPEHTDDMVLGRVFGYSVSDYALATLKWIGADKTVVEFETTLAEMSEARHEDVQKLIESKIYLEY